jgi:hypothetical protein
MVDMITVVGALIDHENDPLGGRRVVGTPRPDTVILGGSAVSLLTDTWTDHLGIFTLACVKAPGVIYTVQTKPERRLPSSLELRCDDWPSGAIVSLGDLPFALPTGVIPGETLDELKAELQAYINANTRIGIPFSDTRLILTVGLGDMRYPNETKRTLHIVAVGIDVMVAPVGADLIVNIRNNGTPIFTDPAHRPRIADGTYSTGPVPVVIDLPVFAPEDVLTVDIDQVGSIIAGGHLTVTVVVQG